MREWRGLGPVAAHFRVSASLEDTPRADCARLIMTLTRARQALALSLMKGEGSENGQREGKDGGSHLEK
jgi:hypothetical protein